MKVVLCAQGGLDPRWTYEGREYLNTPKHLLRLADDEPTLHRTVRQLRDRGVTDITITAPQSDSRYQVPGAHTVHLDLDPNPAGLTLILGTVPLWSHEDRTTIMFGDCWYSDHAIDTIVNVTDPEAHYVRRLNPSKTTGCAWNEPFALIIPHDRHRHVLDTAQRLVARWTGPKRLHMWQHYTALWGLDKREHSQPGPHQTDVDDFTDDIDKPEEFRKWMGRYHANADGVVVLMPWRDGGCTYRKRAHDYVTKRYESYGVPVIEGASPAGAFNRSAAINDAARKAGDWQTAVIVDADTFIPADQMWCAARCAHTSGQLVLAYETWEKLPRVPSTRLVQGRRLNRRERQPSKVVPHHVSSAVAVPRTLFDLVGGFDERFVGWGAEDRAFHAACHAFTGTHDRIDGRATHLYHPPANEKRTRDALYQANRELGQRYKRAAGLTVPSSSTLYDPHDLEATPDTAAMLALMSEPGGPLWKEAT